MHCAIASCTAARLAPRAFACSTAAYALASVSPRPGAPALAAALVLFSAIGRMYFLAHHLLDVCVGALVGGLTCGLLDLVFLDSVGGACGTRWWHPPVGILVLLVTAKAFPLKPTARTATPPAAAASAKEAKQE